jgi:hypothetical protein
MYIWTKKQKNKASPFYWSLFFHKTKQIQVGLAGRCRLGRLRSHRRVCVMTHQDKHSAESFPLSLYIPEGERKETLIILFVFFSNLYPYSARFSLMANGFSLEWLSIPNCIWNERATGQSSSISRTSWLKRTCNAVDCKKSLSISSLRLYPTASLSLSRYYVTNQAQKNDKIHRL